MNIDAYPIETLLLKRKGLRRQLLARPNLQEIRIAVLGGSTTNELVDLLEVLLLDGGFKPVLHQSEYFSDGLHMTPDRAVVISRILDEKLQALHPSS